MKRSLIAIVALVALTAACGAFAGTVHPDALALAFAPADHLHSLFSHPGVALMGMGGVITSAAIRTLQAEKTKAVEAMRAINDKAAKENRDLTEEEQKDYDKHAASVKTLNARIEREQALAAEEAGIVNAAGQGGGTFVMLPNGARISVDENTAKDSKRGYLSFGEFAASVRGATLVAKTGHGQMDPRLAILDPRLNPQAATPTTFGSEQSGTDGGFLVPPDFSKAIWQLALAEDSLLPYCDDVPVSSNGMSFPKDETTPWGTNGIRAYWQGEAVAGTATKPVLGLETLRLKKLLALVAMTDELNADAVALSAYLPKKVGQSIRWKSNEAILFGMGNQQPAGALQSGAVITVAKETGQATATLVPLNLAKMIARLPPGSFPNSVWLMNNDVLPALFTLNNNNQIYYLPYAGPNGPFQGSPYGTLLGRPIMISQHAKSFSSQGDVILVDLSYYQAITKAEGIQTDTSMHLYFDADAMAFRTTFRMDGQSKLTAAITPANGSTNLSPFVQLGAR